MDLDSPYPIASESGPPVQPSEWALFDVEVRHDDAVGLVKQAADTIHDLQRWKEMIEPQALNLIQSVQQERVRWQSERSALMNEINECRLTITATKMALRTALSEKETLSRRYHEAKAAAASSETRARAAEELLAFIYKTFNVELSAHPVTGRIAPIPFDPAGQRPSPE
ncbi:hypothetical protein ASF53_17550 [Methylobacterium sp. Leaf123]|uniref:hypothetical protein n=1 Tax=Methylobacterium sp. Leaf123 TaxID=1736264 RepID=UPI0006F6F7C9|nr:hypothetical protein [Methylobacterium sp. Leaf123]KQQ30906.1 hypothetical protein ASF53_17550 [Methylobacterium sp. Leaf123]